MSVEYVIICDGCACVTTASRQSATQARAALRGAGGRTELPGALDLCPGCVADGVKPS